VEHECPGYQGGRYGCRGTLREIRPLLIELLAAGTRPPEWTRTGYLEYQKRLPRDWQLQLREIPVAHRGKNESIAKLKAEEGRRMLALMKPGARVIALDSRGVNWSTEKLASNVRQWTRDTSHLQLLVGGPDGLSDECLARADDLWSLSKLTFPHFVVRVLLAEQIYRAWAVINHHPYHK